MPTQEELNQQLFDIARNGNDDQMQSVIDAGANVNATDMDGNTPLHIVALQGTTDENLVPRHNMMHVDILIDNGANINAKNSAGNTALHNAIMLRVYDRVTDLLDRNININEQNMDGNTALHLTYDVDDLDVFTATFNELSARGANPNIKNNDGKTLLHLVSKEGSFCYVKFLFNKLDNYRNINNIPIEGDARDKYKRTPLSYAPNINTAYALIKNNAKTSGIKNKNPRASSVIKCLDTLRKTNIYTKKLGTLPDDIKLLTLADKVAVLFLTGSGTIHNPNPSTRSEIAHRQNVIRYMEQKKPNLLKFAMEFHTDNIFKGAGGAIHFTHSLEGVALAAIINNASNIPELKSSYDEYVSNTHQLALSGGTFKQDVATKIQALGRGFIAKKELHNLRVARASNLNMPLGF